MGAIARHGGRRGVEGCQSATEAIVLQGVEASIDRDGSVLEVVAELHAFTIERAERSGLVDAAHVQTHSAALAADKQPVGKIVARVGKVLAKARKVAVDVRTFAGGRIAGEAERPARGPIGQRGGLGLGSRAQAERRQYQSETEFDCEGGHPRYPPSVVTLIRSGYQERQLRCF